MKKVMIILFILSLVTGCKAAEEGLGSLYTDNAKEEQVNKEVMFNENLDNSDKKTAVNIQDLMAQYKKEFEKIKKIVNKEKNSSISGEEIVSQSKDILKNINSLRVDIKGLEKNGTYRKTVMAFDNQLSTTETFLDTLITYYGHFSEEELKERLVSQKSEEGIDFMENNYNKVVDLFYTSVTIQ